jgi:hypothetical protein
MIRWLLAVILVVINVSIFTEEHHLQDWQDEALFHLGNGNAHLLSQEPLHALEDFQKAKSLLDETDESSCSIDFLITFSQVIAYDCLGFHDHCKQSLGSLFLAINEYDDEELTEDSNFSHGENEDPKIAILFLQDLASFTPSREVKGLLFSLIEDMADQSMPAFKFAESPFLESEKFDFDQGQDFSANQCKSFWKRLRKWTKEVLIWVNDLIKICHGVNEVREAYKKWEKEGNDNNLSYEEFKYYYNRYRTN